MVAQSRGVGSLRTTVRRGSTTSTSSTREWSDHLRVTILRGQSVRLRPATLDDLPELARIRATPEVHRHWRGGDDMVAAVLEDFREQDSTAYAIELDGRVVGWIQWQAEEEPEYRHASMDIYVDPGVHGRGVGTDAVRTLARHLIEDHG